MTAKVLLTLWRHGEAGSATNDAARELTDRGSVEVSAMASDFSAWLDAAGLPVVAKLYCSPLIRAQQTAALLAQQGCAERPEICAELVSEAIPESFANRVFDDDTHVVAVTHQPFVSHAIAFWSDDATLAPLAPAGYTTLQVTSLERGGATVLRHRPDPRSAGQMVFS